MTVSNAPESSPLEFNFSVYTFTRQGNASFCATCEVRSDGMLLAKMAGGARFESITAAVDHALRSALSLVNVSNYPPEGA